MQVSVNFSLSLNIFCMGSVTVMFKISHRVTMSQINVSYWWGHQQPQFQTFSDSWQYVLTLQVTWFYCQVLTEWIENTKYTTWKVIHLMLLIPSPDLMFSSSSIILQLLTDCSQTWYTGSAWSLDVSEYLFVQFCSKALYSCWEKCIITLSVRSSY